MLVPSSEVPVIRLGGPLEESRREFNQGGVAALLLLVLLFLGAVIDYVPVIHGPLLDDTRSDHFTQDGVTEFAHAVSGLLCPLLLCLLGRLHPSAEPSPLPQPLEFFLLVFAQPQNTLLQRGETQGRGNPIVHRQAADGTVTASSPS